MCVSKANPLRYGSSACCCLMNNADGINPMPWRLVGFDVQYSTVENVLTDAPMYARLGFRRLFCEEEM